MDGAVLTNLASGLDSPMGIAIDSTAVYWMEFTSGNSSLRTVPQSGGAPATLASQLGMASCLLAVDDSCVYWSDSWDG